MLSIIIKKLNQIKNDMLKYEVNGFKRQKYFFMCEYSIVISSYGMSFYSIEPLSNF